ncbi:MAG: hypothetical protein ACK4RT_03595 [Erythrobacter sp.]
MGTTLNKFVRRYTTMSSALQTLKQSKIVLLSPSKWDDSNDAYFMKLYREKSSSKSVLALCCTMASETYHHWRVFSAGIEGVCIEFKREPLEEAVRRTRGFRAGPVQYLKVKDLGARGPDDYERIPFIKRDGYSDEKEWRVIAETNTITEFMDFDIEIDWISGITFNPWIPPSLADNLRTVIREVCPGIKAPLRSSSLTSSRQWKEAGKRLFG